MVQYDITGCDCRVNLKYFTGGLAFKSSSRMPVFEARCLQRYVTLADFLSVTSCLTCASVPDPANSGVPPSSLSAGPGFSCLHNVKEVCGVEGGCLFDFGPV